MDDEDESAAARTIRLGKPYMLICADPTWMTDEEVEKLLADMRALPDQDHPQDGEHDRYDT